MLNAIFVTLTLSSVYSDTISTILKTETQKFPWGTFSRNYWVHLVGTHHKIERNFAKKNYLKILLMGTAK